MTTQEITKLIGVIKATYPNFGANTTDEIKKMVAAWSFLLDDYKAEDIFMAFKMFVSTSGSAFAPSVAELIGILNKSRESGNMNASEAWGIVEKAIRNSLYGAEEEFEKFPEGIKKTVGSPSVLRSWGMSDIDTIGTVVASNFKKNYEVIQKRKTEMARLPESVRIRLAEATGMIEEKHG